MANSQRVEQIQQCLTEAFQPTHLEIIDESHKHAGHAGAKDGKGHFQVHIVSDAFSEQVTIKRHRQVYAALKSLMETDIHALSIQAQTPDELATS